MSIKKEKEKEKESRRAERRGGGRGTHGSIVKSGKVRSQTPQIPSQHPDRKNKSPRIKNRQRYMKMIMGKSHTTPKKRIADF